MKATNLIQNLNIQTFDYNLMNYQLEMVFHEKKKKNNNNDVKFSVTSSLVQDSYRHTQLLDQFLVNH